MIKERISKAWQAYLAKENTWGHISNVIFIVFLLLMLIPSTRIVVSEQLIKLTLFDRGSISLDEREALSARDLSLPFFNADESLSLADLNGEVVIINYWATWCPPCIAEMPNFQELYNAYGDKVNFIFASNEKVEVIDEFFEEKGYDLPVYSYKYLAEGLQHSSIPTTYVIDAHGQVVFSHTGAYKWNSESVQEMLDELIAESTH